MGGAPIGCASCRPSWPRGACDVADPRHGTEAADAARVDDLRQRLRSLGYLDAGVDRFVLAPAGRGHRPAVIALFASARIGALAALLLGPAAAVGLVSRMPGLVTGPRDAVVAGIYLGVLFGVCAAVVRSEEHTSELQSRLHLVCRLLLEKKKKNNTTDAH